MRAALAAAIVLALGAVVLGVLALTEDEDSFERLTLELTEEEENEETFDAGREPAILFESEISGDRAGQFAGICLPAGLTGIGCVATYLLEDGTITTQNIRLGEESDQTEIVSPIIGGTGAYQGAGGTRTIPDPDSGEHTLDLLLPTG